MPELTADDLIAIGVTSVGHRRKLLAAIAALGAGSPITVATTAPRDVPVNRLNANLGPRVSIVDNQGKLLSRIGDPFAGRALTSFIGPHGLTVDSHGDLYVAEVCWTLWPGLFPDQPRPDNLRTIQKYQRVH